MNARAYLVSWRELAHKLHQDKSIFLWHCYLQFRAKVTPENEDDLVLIWSSDYTKMHEFYIRSGGDLQK